MFKLGDYKVVCDACGMDRYASECNMRWDGFFVCPQCYSARPAQDFVVGIPDDQSVPIARPDEKITQGETTVLTTALQNAVTIDITSITGLANKDPITIVLDNGAAHTDYCNGTPAGNTVTLGSYLPSKASAGNAVYLPSINNLTYTSGISATEL